MQRGEELAFRSQQAAVPSSRVTRKCEFCASVPLFYSAAHFLTTSPHLRITRPNTGNLDRECSTTDIGNLNASFPNSFHYPPKAIRRATAFALRSLERGRPGAQGQRNADHLIM